MAYGIPDWPPSTRRGLAHRTPEELARQRAAEMSALKALRKKVAYEGDVPRCSTCRHFKPGRTVLINSLPRPLHPMCKLHGFKVAAHGVCDTWIDRAGSTLERGA